MELLVFSVKSFTVIKMIIVIAGDLGKCVQSVKAQRRRCVP